MQDNELTSEPAKLSRIAAIDVARGASLVGMGVYHLTWDLAYFGFVSASLPFTPAMRVFSHGVASAFLALVGVSLALAHPDGLRRRAFARRFALVAGTAPLVTAATYLIDPAEPIYFGILHCIAVASLVAAPFVGAPAWTALAAGVAALAAPLAVASDSLDAPALVAAALKQRDGEEAASLRLYWRIVARFSGDMGVAFVATGGVTLAGGVLPRIVDFLDDSAFRRAFEAKAPVAALARAIPTRLIMRADGVLVGMAAIAAAPRLYAVDFAARGWA